MRRTMTRLRRGLPRAPVCPGPPRKVVLFRKMGSFPVRSLEAGRLRLRFPTCPFPATAMITRSVAFPPGAGSPPRFRTPQQGRHKTPSSATAREARRTPRHAKHGGMVVVVALSTLATRKKKKKRARRQPAARRRQTQRNLRGWKKSPYRERKPPPRPRRLCRRRERPRRTA